MRKTDFTVKVNLESVTVFSIVILFMYWGYPQRFLQTAERISIAYIEHKYAKCRTGEDNE